MNHACSLHFAGSGADQCLWVSGCFSTLSRTHSTVNWALIANYLSIHNSYGHVFFVVVFLCRRSHKSSKGGHKHAGGEAPRDGLSSPPAKVARPDAASPQKSSTNGGGRTVHTLPAEEQADGMEDENFQASCFPFLSFGA